ncbi:MAG: SEC-C domain-containing protein [Chloroflexi bacterium]|nr:SEC-C domain-containing protein [Chloroflexota bacterium]
MAKQVKIPISRQELESQLEDHLHFLQKSCQDFDNGDEREAKRISITLRILLHSTRTSHSLLDQLGRKNISFYDTSTDDYKGNLSIYKGLTAEQLIPGGIVYKARLQKLRSSRWTKFDEWWTKIIMDNRKGLTFSRRDFVLYVADQDGGAHVDPAIDERYVELSRKNPMQLFIAVNANQEPVTHIERVTIRQIAHEVLGTMIPNYTFIPPPITHEGPWVADLAVVPGTKPPPTTPIKKIGRNDPCPCGSDKKYKYCHGIQR